MSGPPVVLAFDSAANHGAIILACEKITILLSQSFGITDVTIRSLGAPLDRLIGLGNDGPTPLWVVLSSGPDSLPAIQILQKDSPFPVLNLSEKEVVEAAWTIAKVCALSSPSIATLVRTYALAKRQARLIDDAQLKTKSPKYAKSISAAYDFKLQVTGDVLMSGVKESTGIDGRRGKVRDQYDLGDTIALVTTDRMSGFDRHLALVPFKGAVLNMTSAFWFAHTTHIIPNHIVDVPHPNVSVVKKCKPFPIEFVVRSYMTGSTSTSIWKNYQDGVRVYCGHQLPDGMKKNQKLSKNLLTPTTKEEEHDRPISADEIVKENWMTQEDWDVCAKSALEVFAYGQKVAAMHGLILVDTKYEFGRDVETGEILLIDEVHTPDSSRYWLSSSYAERIASGKEPENIDKEFLRLWFREHCDPYKDKTIPEAPRDLVLELSRRYVSLFEMITWKDFDFGKDGSEKSIINVIQSIAPKSK